MACHQTQPQSIAKRQFEASFHGAQPPSFQRGARGGPDCPPAGAADRRRAANQEFLHLQKEQLGFVSANVLTMRLQLSPVYYPEPADRAGFLQRIKKQLETLPGMQAVGAVSQLPLSGAVLSSGFSPIDDSPLRDQPPETADLRGVRQVTSRHWAFL